MDKFSIVSPSLSEFDSELPQKYCYENDLEKRPGQRKEMCGPSQGAPVSTKKGTNKSEIELLVIN